MLEFYFEHKEKLINDVDMLFNHKMLFLTAKYAHKVSKIHCLK